MVSYSCCLALLAFAPMILGSNPGVEVRLTKNGLEYGDCQWPEQFHVLSILSEINKQKNNPTVLTPSRPSDRDGLNPEEAADYQHPRHVRKGEGEGGEGGVPAFQVR